MIGDGLVLTAVGMAMVFLFLIVLVFAMDLLAKAVKMLEKFMPEPAKATAGPMPSDKPRVAAQPKDDLSILAAVIAAASRFKK